MFSAKGNCLFFLFYGANSGHIRLYIFTDFGYIEESAQRRGREAMIRREGPGGAVTLFAKPISKAQNAMRAQILLRLLRFLFFATKFNRHDSNDRPGVRICR
jgi:hypothetical protein